MKAGGQPQNPAVLSLGNSPRNTGPRYTDVLEKGKISCPYRDPKHESSRLWPGPFGKKR
jgi:hypothetical protein